MRLFWLAAAAATSSLSYLSACVSDSAPPVDSGLDQSASDAATQDVAAQDVAEQDVAEQDAGPDAVSCGGGQPATFPPVPDAGPFCSGAGPGNHCVFGQHCCFDESTKTRTCAASCEAGVADIACFSKAECPSGSQCCGNGTPNVSVCTYAVVESFTGTVCASSCGQNQYVDCASGSDCSGKACVAAFALDPTNDATSTIQVGACL